MGYQDFLSKIRYWDNIIAKWMVRHVYILFLQIVLFIIFLFWFVNIFHVMDTSFSIDKANNIERMMSAQSINTAILVFLVLLNSFLMLYIFSSITRLRTVLRDIHYTISRFRAKYKP